VNGTSDKERFLYLEGLRSIVERGDEAAREALSDDEKRDLLMHLRDSNPVPCWMCGSQANRYRAAGTYILHEFPPDGYQCPRCGVPMQLTIPLMQAPMIYLWMKPTALAPVQIIEAVERLAYARIVFLVASKLEIENPDDEFTKVYEAVGDSLPDDLTMIVRYTAYPDALWDVGTDQYTSSVEDAQGVEDVLAPICQWAMTNDVLDAWKQSRRPKEDPS
jgi:hypothetical protein